MSKVLVIDDDENVCRVLEKLVEKAGHEAEYACTLSAGLQKAAAGGYDVVFLDVGMPDGNGLQALETVQKSPGSPEVVIISGMGDPAGAELAIKSGAWDYVQKPLSPKKMFLPLTRVLRYRESLRSPIAPPPEIRREDIVGASRKINACLQSMVKAAQTGANILITGETGTGKELFAKALHDNSPRASQSFVIVDCAALPETLIESVLFGHEKGAFTGADKPKDGLVKQADGGTLFLDEVGELSPALQKSFLRVLQERRFRPVGGGVEQESNFRLVSATNKNLESMVRKGLFREDLFHRLSTIAIELPPLRERLEDIVPLSLHFTRRICRNACMEVKGVSPDCLEALSVYGWPGNVRELFNVMEEAIYRAGAEPSIIPQNLPDKIRINLARVSLESSRGVTVPDSLSPTPSIPKDLGAEQREVGAYKDFREQVLNRMESQYLRDLMQQTRGDIKKACRVSGLGRSRLYALLKKNEVSRMGWPDS